MPAPSPLKPHLTEEISAGVAISRNFNSKDASLCEVLDAATRRQRPPVKKIEPSQNECVQAIWFFPPTRHMRDDGRQDFILLSDVLEVSMPADAINSRNPAGTTQNTDRGPSHIEDAPEYPMGTNICLDAKGGDMVVHGRVLDVNGTPLEGAKIDVWQANDEGFYDAQQKGMQPEIAPCGVLRTGPDGTYCFKTVRPKRCSISADTLLDGFARNPWCAAHLRYVISKNGYDELTTQILDPCDPFIDNDAVSGITESPSADFVKVEDPERIADLGFECAHYWDVNFDFVLIPKDSLQ